MTSRWVDEEVKNHEKSVDYNWLLIFFIVPLNSKCESFDLPTSPKKWPKKYLYALPPRIFLHRCEDIFTHFLMKEILLLSTYRAMIFSTLCLLGVGAISLYCGSRRKTSNMPETLKRITKNARNTKKNHQKCQKHEGGKQGPPHCQSARQPTKLSALESFDLYFGVSTGLPASSYYSP